MRSTIHDIIIVGAGLSGLGCAKRLHENGKKFLMITENIGGRVMTSPDGEVNYGAYYITKDCTTVMPYLTKVRRMRLKDYYFDFGERQYTFSVWSAIKHARALRRLAYDVFIFRRHFKAMRRRSFDESREALIEADPLLRKYYHQKAGDYIHARGLEALTREYLEEPLWGSFFVDPRIVPTFIFLQCLFPLFVPTYSFIMHFSKIAKAFSKHIIKDSVISVFKKDDVFVLKTKTGKSYYTNMVVLATPMTVTNTLVTPQKIKGTIECSFIHLRGTIKESYTKKSYYFFRLEDETVIAKEMDGSFLYFYTGKNRVDEYFDSWKPITVMTWKPALLLLGDAYVNLNPEPGVFLANDHNVASTEDSFINGMYTAKMVLEYMKYVNA